LWTRVACAFALVALTVVVISFRTAEDLRFRRAEDVV
jgi:hypothetical protein